MTRKWQHTRGGRHRAALVRLVRAVGGAFTGGAYFTRLSIGLSLIVCAFLSIPTIGAPSVSGFLRGALVGALGWLPLLALGALAALAERRMRGRIARVAVIAITLLVIATIRPFLNDVISQALFDTSTGGRWSSRIITNVVTAATVLTLCSIASAYHRASRRTTARLVDAVARMRGRMALAAAFGVATRGELTETVARLRTRRDQLLAGTVDFDTVRAYSNEVRAASHRFDALATTTPPPPAPQTHPTTRPVPVLGRLTPTPPPIVGLLYALVCVSYAATTGGPLAALGAFIGPIVIDHLAALALRTVRPAHPSARGILFLIVWTAAGALTVGLAFALLPGIGSLGVISLVGVPVTAVAVSLTMDAYLRAHAEERRATAVLTASARDLAAAVERARLPLRRAAALLHGRVQGRCVILAAHVDENAPTPELLARFRAETDAAFDDVLAATPPTGAGTLTDLLSAWETVIDVDAHVAPDAGIALDHPDAAHAAVEIVNEALVNAVKHSAARKARIDVALASPEHLQVQVVSPGRLLGGPRGLGLRAEHTRLAQVGDDVVLEALVPVG